MSKVEHLVPKADPEIEQVFRSPWATYQFANRLKERGVVWTEPQDKPLTHAELVTVLRVVCRELRMRENMKSGEDRNG